MNIVDAILFQCRRQPPAAAMCAPGPGIGLISYRRLEQFIHAIGRRLMTAGLAPGHVVAVDINDVIFHAAVVLAAARLGIATLSLRGVWSIPLRINALISDTNLPSGAVGRVIHADMSWTEGDGRPLDVPPIPPATADICRIILTPDATGEPKAVAVGHRLLTDRIARYPIVLGGRFAGCQRIYSDLPFSMSLGFELLVHGLSRGGTVFFPGDSFEHTLQAFEQYRVQCVVGSAAGLELLLKWYDGFSAYQSNLDLVVSAGVMPQPLADRIRARICSHLYTVHEAAETGISAAAHAHEIDGTPGAVGFVAPGVFVQAVDPAGTVLPPGEDGVIRVLSEHTVDRYLGSPGDSARAFSHGWFYPGDVGRVGADGLLIVSGREPELVG